MQQKVKWNAHDKLLREKTFWCQGDAWLTAVSDLKLFYSISNHNS